MIETNNTTNTVYRINPAEISRRADAIMKRLTDEHLQRLREMPSDNTREAMDSIKQLFNESSDTVAGMVLLDICDFPDLETEKQAMRDVAEELRLGGYQ